MLPEYLQLLQLLFSMLFLTSWRISKKCKEYAYWIHIRPFVSAHAEIQTAKHVFIKFDILVF